MLVLIDFPSTFGLRSLSPFGYKAEVLLALAGLDYSKQPPEEALLPHGKVPVLKDGNRLIPDSSLIQQHLEQHHGLDADKKLTDYEMATAEAFRRMAEEHLRWSLVYSRWIEPANEAAMRDKVLGFLPEPDRAGILAQVRETVGQALYHQGLGRHTPEAIYAFGCRDLDAIAAVLDDKPFFLADRPTTIDATLAGLLINILCPALSSPLQRHAAAIPAFSAYVRRVEETVFGAAARLPEAA